MTRQLKSIFILLLLSTSTLQAGNNSDSLLGIWWDHSNPEPQRIEALNACLADENSQLTHTAMQALVDTFETLAKMSEKPKLISRSYFHQASIKQQQSDYPASIMYYNQAIDMCLAIQDTVGLVDAYIGLGENSNFMGKFGEANSYYFKARSLIKGYSDARVLIKKAVKVSNNIGVIYFQLAQFTKAIEYFDQALQRYKTLNETKGVTGSYINIGACHLKLEHYDDALRYFDSSLVVIENNKISPVYKANALSNIGAVLIYKEDTAAGIVKTEEAIAIYRSMGSHYNEAISLNQIAAVTSGSVAIARAQAALNIAEDIKAENLQLEIYNLLYTKYKEMGEADSAFMMLERHQVLEEQMNEKGALLQLSEHEMEMQLDSLESANAGNITNLKDKGTRIFLLIGGLGLLLITMLLVIMRRRAKKQAQEKDHLLDEIKNLKAQFNPVNSSGGLVNSEEVRLDREKLETLISGKLNDTDWNVLNALIDNPVMSNKEIAGQVHMSVDGIRSSLKKMYGLFDTPTSQNMRLALVLRAIHLSGHSG